jgi:hypothetical protein
MRSEFTSSTRAHRKNHEEAATITISNGQGEMSFAGKMDSNFADESPSHASYFLQWDLGSARQDEELYGKKWKVFEAKVLYFLGAGMPLTISAEGKSYVLPPIKVKSLKRRFRNIC